MNSIENLFIVASEECSEIQQCISKILRFGKSNHHPSRPEDTNAKELLKEYYQLQAVMDMIIDGGVLYNLSESEIMQIKDSKKLNVLKYSELSKQLGFLKD